MESNMLDQAFEALKTYDWGTDPKVLSPIDQAVLATQSDAAARRELEDRLAAVLKTDAPRAAKDAVCRQLMIVGTAASVPALAELLPVPELSHMARYALERIPAPEADQALRDALPKVTGELRIGVISALGARRDAASVPALVALLGDADAATARAAALALGAIAAPGATTALRNTATEDPAVKVATIDACLASAEALLADGKKLEAMAVYKAFTGEEQPKHVRLAATRGMLACAGR
jgi:HEAT repeat protein